MKALTIWQPWAWCIIHGGKDVENRRWPAKHRGPLAIHAAAKRDTDYYNDQRRWIKETMGVDVPPIEDVGFGVVVGVVDVTGMTRRRTSPWFEGPWGWQLARPYAVIERAVTGKQSLWTVDDSLIVRAGAVAPDDIPTGLTGKEMATQQWRARQARIARRKAAVQSTPPAIPGVARPSHWCERCDSHIDLGGVCPGASAFQSTGRPLCHSDNDEMIREIALKDKLAEVYCRTCKTFKHRRGVNGQTAGPCDGMVGITGPAVADLERQMKTCYDPEQITGGSGNGHPPGSLADEADHPAGQDARSQRRASVQPYGQGSPCRP